MFSVFSVLTQTHKNKSIVNLYQKELIGYFSEYIKVWPSHNVLNWLTVTGYYTTYMQIVWAYIPMLIGINIGNVKIHYSSQKVSEKETALNCCFGFAIVNTIKVANLKQFH